MERIDQRAIPDDSEEIRVFSAVRNEAAKLPFFLSHYRGLGAHRFFFVDNGSTDGTRDYLAQQPDVHLFTDEGSYAAAEVGMAWIRALLDQYGLKHWCIVADADEHLIYPHFEQVSLTDLCTILTAEQATCMFCLLLDMYSDQPICRTAYPSDGSLLAACPFFDPASHAVKMDEPLFDYEASAVKRLIVGGVRSRVFGLKPWLNKAVLFKNAPGVAIDCGAHAIKGVTVSATEGVVLHFKFFEDFCERAALEAARKEHAGEAFDYHFYDRMLQAQPELSLHGAESVRFAGSSQLQELGLMRMSAEYAAVINAPRQSEQE